MTTQLLGVGYSPCPNDTFMFHALMHGIVKVPGVRFIPALADIEELNRRAERDDALPFTKLSIGALAAVAHRYSVVSAGAALGRGFGPLVVARSVDGAPRGIGDLAGRRLAIPGTLTTAWLLFRLFGPDDVEVVEMRFDRILGAVARGEVDAGLIIHESRFTYAEHGLERVADVGELWEQDTGLPLPLGVIAASRGLTSQLVRSFDRGLRVSIKHAFADPSGVRSYVRAHAQETSDAVCDRHIALYVNEFSIDLGAIGRQAIDELLMRGRAQGLLPGTASPWR